jgi:uncharacterized protein (TIGR02145 family)
MKSTFITLIFIIVLNYISQEQNYQISFSGSGASTNVDSVKVENLTQCTSINLSGIDILNLVGSIGISELNSVIENKISIYPNPSEGICFVDFEAITNGKVTIALFDISGKIIIQTHELLSKGNNSFQINGISNGIYTIMVESETYNYTSKIISISERQGIISIKKIDFNANSFQQIAKIIDSKKSTVLMQYNIGDLLKLTGKSGVFRTVFMIVPTNNQNVNFIFIPCIDSNGNNYSIVQIGNQWWMAENLNAGSYVPITTPQVSGTKFCMNVNGQADPNCPMGGLYEWNNLMQGAVQCNGSGAPPNDKCANPVKGLCPNGWHIPSHYEWTTLEKNSGSNPGAFPYNTSTISLLGTDEGGNLKQTCTTYWWAPNAGATNTTGFSGLPGGDTWNGVFEDFGQSGYFWTSTEPFFMAWVHALNYSLTVIGRSSYAIESGFSCRCVKD